VRVTRRGERNLARTHIIPENTTMKKLELNVDELRVESFPTDGAAAERGTVRANSLSWGESYCNVCETYSGPVHCFC